MTAAQSNRLNCNLCEDIRIIVNLQSLKKEVEIASYNTFIGRMIDKITGFAY